MPLHLARKLLANVSSRKSSSTSVPRGIPDADRGPAPEISRPSVVLHATLSSSSRGLEPEAVRSGLEPVTTDEASSHSGQSGSSKLGNRLFLHFEVLDSRRHKAGQSVFLIMFVLGALSLGVTIYINQRLDVLQLPDSDTQGLSLSSQANLHIIYLSLGCFLLSIVTTMAFFCVRSYYKVRHCSWKRRHRYLVIVAHSKLYLQLVNLVFWIMANAHALAEPCHFFSPLSDVSTAIRYTCWNTICALQIVHICNCKPALKRTDGRASDPVPDTSSPRYNNNEVDPMILDGAFLREHWLLFSIWVIAEIFTIGQVIWGSLNWYHTTLRTSSICPAGDIPIDVRPEWRIMSIIDGTALILYQICIGFLPRYYASILSRQSYTSYQFANLLVLWQRRQSIWLEVLTIADIWNILYQPGSLVGYLQSWYGQMCVQVILSTSGILDAYYLLPMEPRNEEHIYQALLQQFVWTRGQVLDRRKKFHQFSPAYSPVLQDQPVFCMQTALELILWSNVCYENDPEGGQPALSAEQRAILDEQADGDGFSSAGNSLSESESELASRRTVFGRKESLPPEDSPRKQDTSGSPRLGGMENSSPRRNRRKKEVVITQHNLKLLETKLSQQIGTPLGQDSQPLENVQETTIPILDEVNDLVSSAEQIRLGMKMFGLKELKIFRGTKTDTKAVLAWSDKCMVLAFRGTSSITNVNTDAMAWRTPHLPRRGTYWLGTQCLVHRGFQRAWHDVEVDVLQAAQEVIDKASVTKEEFEVYVTGHSLAGVLACLSSYSLRTKLDLTNLTCYTFGAPRPGNAAFAKELHRLVPNMYHIINDSDPIPQIFKVFVLYKRPGHRVLINWLGDIRVRPTLFETSLHSGGFSIKQHFLESYMDALGAICVAQFIKAKALEDGLAGVKRLRKVKAANRLLLAAGIDLQRLIQNPPVDFQKAVSHVQQHKAKSDFRRNLSSLARELKNLPLPVSAEE